MRARRRWDRVFYLAMAVALAAVVFAGFSRSFYLRPAVEGPLPRLLVVHGLLFSSWIVLLIAQTTLVAAGRVELHRRLGVAGAAIAALMVVVGTLTALSAARRSSTSNSALEFLIVPLADMVVFGTLVGTAVRLRRRAEAHKRLMILATIALLPAAVARLPLAFIQHGGSLEVFAVVNIPLVACVVYDLITRRRVHPALLVGGGFLVASQPLRVALGGTELWLTFARWLVG